MITQLVMPEKKMISLAIKKRDHNKYYISTLSTSHVNTTTIYNNGVAVVIKDNVVDTITDPVTLEALRLNSFISLDHGYKKLGYNLTRLEDQKFRNFDCHTVLVESPLGRKTVNYYDKATGKLIMIINPDETRSIIIDHHEALGLTVPYKMLLTDTKKNVSQSTLQKIIYGNNLDATWFRFPDKATHEIPDIFRTGVFKYVYANDGAIVTREKDSQVEVSAEKRFEHKVRWESNSDYILYRLKDPSAPATDSNIEYIKVKIINWKGNRYYCHYILLRILGGTCVFEKLK